MLRDGRKAKTMQVRLMDGDVEIGRCTALLTAQGGESPADPFSESRGDDAAAGNGHAAAGLRAEMEPLFPERIGAADRGRAGKSRVLRRHGCGSTCLWSRARATRRCCRPCRRADFASGVGQIVDMREWTFINPEISLHFFRPPEGDWILIRSRTRAGANGAGPTMATLERSQGRIRGSAAGDDLRAACRPQAQAS